MATASPLPANWTLVLEQILSTLTQAIHIAETREAAHAEREVAGHSVLPADILAKHLEGLDQRIQGMETPLRAFDRTLQSEEEDVRRHLAMVADLRQRLAEWKMI
jgi:hypothetical protein